MNTCTNNFPVSCGLLEGFSGARFCAQTINNDTQGYTRQISSLETGIQREMPRYPRKVAALSSLSGKYNEYYKD
jgi:hypothetical protein